jgi:hypothetical protein
LSFAANCPAILECHIASVDKANFVQPSAKRCDDQQQGQIQVQPRLISAAVCSICDFTVLRYSREILVLRRLGFEYYEYDKGRWPRFCHLCHLGVVGIGVFARLVYDDNNSLETSSGHLPDRGGVPDQNERALADVSQERCERYHGAAPTSSTE